MDATAPSVLNPYPPVVAKATVVAKGTGFAGCGALIGRGAGLAGLAATPFDRPNPLADQDGLEEGAAGPGTAPLPRLTPAAAEGVTGRSFCHSPRPRQHTDKKPRCRTRRTRAGEEKGSSLVSGSL